MTPQEVHLKIVEEGRCDPYRALGPLEIVEDREDAVCVECRHVSERSWNSDLEARYSCRKDPKYEEHKNFVDGKQMFFDREGWNRILGFRDKEHYEWALKKKESEYFHSAQSYGSCMKINTEGRCENFERPVNVKEEIARSNRLWIAQAKPMLIGLMAGVLLALVGVWIA